MNLDVFFEAVFAAGQFGHFYVIEGRDITAASSVANHLAAGLLCHHSRYKGCGLCHSCLSFAAGTHPELSVFTTEPDKQSISVDSSRHAESIIHIKPHVSARRVIMVLPAHLLTEQAQNAFLKTLEEPPPYATVIFVTDNSARLLSTVLSRAMLLNADQFKNLPPSYSTEDAARVGQCLPKLADGSYLETLNAAQLITKERGVGIFWLFASFLRDATLISLGCDNPNLITHKAHMEHLNNLAATCNAAALIRAADSVLSHGSKINRSSNYNLWALNIMLEIRRVLTANGNNSGGKI